MIRRGTLTLIAAVLVIAGCTTTATPTASPSASGAAAIVITEKTVGELQAVLVAQRGALSKGDLKAYQATYDTARPAFRRCKQEAFDIAGRQGVGGTAPRILKVTPYLDTYVRAWVDEGSNGLVRTYFRMVDGKWIQSEPTSDEVGAEKNKTFDTIDINYWGVDDDVIDALGKGTLEARDFVVKNELTGSKKPFGIRFYPTRGVAGLQECSVVGFHIPNAPADDKFIRFFRYWFTGDMKSLSPVTITFIQHEGLHWAQDQFITGITARLDWWLVEGWPDYIGQSRSTDYKRTVVCSTATPTLKQFQDGPRTDLPETNPEDAVRYYAFANTMIEYLYAQFGPNAYRDLLVAYEEVADANKNFPLVLKVGSADFYTGWVAFAKKKYC
ncbi:MAG: hypothetical protein HYX56_00050 [Chloroflexi bacterium]|nr:hypothetical protein [Chloroflexota bacterium]